MLTSIRKKKKGTNTMPKIIEASLVAKGKKFGIIVSRFNDWHRVWKTCLQES